MQETKHIHSQQWKVLISKNYVDVVTCERFPKTIATLELRDEGQSKSDKEMIMNAKLMAASVDMFKLLTYISDQNDGVGICLGYQADQMIDDVLKKVNSIPEISRFKEKILPNETNRIPNSPENKQPRIPAYPLHTRTRWPDNK